MTTCYEITTDAKRVVVCQQRITLRELCRLCGCKSRLMARLVDLGLLEPVERGEEAVFTQQSVLRARKALRLKRDLGLNLESLALIMDLLDRIEELERRLTKLQ